MTARRRAWLILVLITLGAGWGLTMPLTKIAVSTGYKHFGLLFWQMAIGCLVMSALALPLGLRLPFGAAHMRVYVIIALIGSVLPNTASYQAAVHLPSGVLSILLSRCLATVSADLRFEAACCRLPLPHSTEDHRSASVSSRATRTS